MTDDQAASFAPAKFPAEPAAAVTVVYGPHCSHDDCGWITCGESGLVEFCCLKPACPHCGGLRNEPEDWADDPARFAAMTPAEQDRARAYWARYPLRRRGPDDTCERADRDLAEPEDDDFRADPHHDPSAAWDAGDDRAWGADDEWRDE